MDEEGPDEGYVIGRLMARRRVTKVVLQLAREVERLSDDNAQLRAALEFYRNALETVRQRHAGGSQKPLDLSTAGGLRLESGTMPLTITKLARACGLSRTTVLYYESLGLLRPARRSAGNYRMYSDVDLARLREVCAYRASGLRLSDIRSILERPRGEAAAVLQRRLLEISGEIETLREHQRAIARLLGETKRMRRTRMVTKQRWVEIMRAAGFSDEQMHRWHREFEKTAPVEHQEFLEFLRIPADEVKQIREWSSRRA